MAGLKFLLCVVGTLVCTCVVWTGGCNEAVCASVVSKCMLLQACRCNLRENCSCCKECWNCLGPMYSDCCSCVGMCPKPNDTYTGLGQKSHVERLEPFDELFRVLTNEPDLEDRWTAFEYPITFMREEDDIDLDPNAPVTVTSVTASPSGSVGSPSSTGSESTPNRRKVLELKCRVAYMSQCMSWNKCKESCSSMGADSYRWFHDGCCECVGYTCVNYGIDESRCSRCPLDEDGDDDEDEDSNGTDYSYEDESEGKSEEKGGQVDSEKDGPSPADIEREAADEKESPDNPIDENG